MVQLSHPYMTTGKTIALTLWILLVAQTVKSLPAMQETQVQSLGREDLPEKEMATHSSILAWKIPWTEEPGGLQSMGSQRVDMTDALHFHFVSKVMSLLFNMLSRFVIAFLPRSKHLLISWLQLLSAVIFGAQENKVSHGFHCFPICLP